MPTPTVQHAADVANYSSQLFPLGVGAAMLFGISVTDWALLLSLLIGILNVLWFGVRFYDRFTEKKRSATAHAGEGNPPVKTKSRKKR